MPSSDNNKNGDDVRTLKKKDKRNKRRIKYKTMTYNYP